MINEFRWWVIEIFNTSQAEGGYNPYWREILSFLAITFGIFFIVKVMLFLLRSDND